jgi:hypothetical protein
MKIRNGFVSNSSSSSFVIKGGTTTSQIATMMMYEVRSNWEGSTRLFEDECGLPDGFEEALEWLHDNVEYNEPIMFPWSTNYETFIWTVGKDIYVDTCNNQDWGLLGPTYSNESGEYYTDIVYNDVYSHSFLNLRDMQQTTKRGFMDAERERWRQEREKNESS